jgi:hypothetical protein
MDQSRAHRDMAATPAGRYGEQKRHRGLPHTHAAGHRHGKVTRGERERVHRGKREDRRDS